MDHAVCNEPVFGRKNNKDLHEMKKTELDKIVAFRPHGLAQRTESAVHL
jgi:hypothetical protein